MLYITDFATPAEEATVKIQVECYSEYEDIERPARFSLGERTVEVTEVADRWYGKEASYFRVSGDDGNLYILKGPLADGTWELVSFTHRDSRGTELEFEGKKQLQ